MYHILKNKLGVGFGVDGEGGVGVLWFVFTCDLVKSLLAVFEWTLDTGSSSSFCRFLFIVIDQFQFLCSEKFAIDAWLRHPKECSN